MVEHNLFRQESEVEPLASEVRRDSELGPLLSFANQRNSRPQPWRMTRVLPTRRNSTGTSPQVSQPTPEPLPQPERPLRVSVCVPAVLNRQVCLGLMLDTQLSLLITYHSISSFNNHHLPLFTTI
jgi:hypothetical protein